MNSPFFPQGYDWPWLPQYQHTSLQEVYGLDLPSDLPLKPTSSCTPPLLGQLTGLQHKQALGFFVSSSRLYLASLCYCYLLLVIPGDCLG
jgi:hypothetical protein